MRERSSGGGMLIVVQRNIITADINVVDLSTEVWLTTHAVHYFLKLWNFFKNSSK